MCVAVRDLREQFGATPKYVHRFFEGYSAGCLEVQGYYG
jgi:hypothetical protein